MLDAQRAALSNAGAVAPNPAELPDWDRDFNGRLRASGSIGAYADFGPNRGWRPALSVMPH
jgi:hypothetical protein